MPRSLLGQMLLIVALALLVAQALAGVLLWRAGERAREGMLLNTVAFRFVAGELREPRRELEERDEGRDEDRREGRRYRLRYLETLPPIMQSMRDQRREAALREILLEEDVAVQELVVATIRRDSDPLRGPREGGRGDDLRPDGQASRIVLAALRRDARGPWLVTRVVERPRERGFLSGIVIQTLITYLVLVGLLALLLRRVTRPLAKLAQRIEHFGATRDAGGQIAPDGPEDIRTLIAAHNALETRIAALLDEKDVMLGAIGHDLKTPLAALRVRIESVPDDNQRAKMAATIEEITASLDDILTLARIGKGDGPSENAELTALAASVVEEFEDMGEPVTLADSPRLAAPVHLTWLKRALRNLVSNAVRYGGSAEVSASRDGGMAVLAVEDHGPGIPEGRIDAMMEPFARGEASRNRTTGGAGLGLAIARAIADQHRGVLVLSNRPEGGLRAELRLPL
ncbi:MAG: ATP-binding protein [Sphingomonadaceae bacterium]